MTCPRPEHKDGSRKGFVLFCFPSDDTSMNILNIRKTPTGFRKLPDPESTDLTGSGIKIPGTLCDNEISYLCVIIIRKICATK